MSNKEDGTATDKLKPLENQELVNKLAIEIMEPAIQKAIKDASGVVYPRR